MHLIDAQDLDQRFERMSVSAVWNPDGYFIELNQLLGQSAGNAPDEAKGEQPKL